MKISTVIASVAKQSRGMRTHHEIASLPLAMTARGGFTLLEVLLALALFSIIALASVEQIKLVRNTKVQNQEEAEIYNGLRAAINVMRNDLQQAFHISYDDLGEETQELIQKSQPVAHTLFDGRKDQLVFTALSHRNFYAGKKECEQTEISFFLQNKGKGKTASLMKRESERIDADLYQGGGIYTILNNVTSLEFQYWDEKTGNWVNDWNSDGGNTRDRFPAAVKMKIEIVGSRKGEMKLETSFKIAFPNNEAVLAQLQ
jgi:type II secretion system protein J